MVLNVRNSRKPPVKVSYLPVQESIAGEQLRNEWVHIATSDILAGGCVLWE